MKYVWPVFSWLCLFCKYFQNAARIMQFIIQPGTTPNDERPQEPQDTLSLSLSLAGCQRSCRQAPKMQTWKMPTKMLIYFQLRCAFVCANNVNQIYRHWGKKGVLKKARKMPLSDILSVSIINFGWIDPSLILEYFFWVLVL